MSNRPIHNATRGPEERLALARRIRALLHPTSGADPMTKRAVSYRLGTSPATIEKLLKELQEHEAGA